MDNKPDSIRRRSVLEEAYEVEDISRTLLDVLDEFVNGPRPKPANQKVDQEPKPYTVLDELIQALRATTHNLREAQTVLRHLIECVAGEADVSEPVEQSTIANTSNVSPYFRGGIINV